MRPGSRLFDDQSFRVTDNASVPQYLKTGA